MRFHRIIATVFVTLFVGINAFLFSDYLGFEKIYLVTERGDTYKIRVEIADTFGQKQKGLMHRRRLEVGRGMLFIYQEPVTPSFWMKNMCFPLDMIFIGKDLRVKTIHEKVLPCEAEPCELYSPSSPIQYVLEVPGGYSQLFKIKSGDRVEFETTK
ncbi:DUF192 domain-containing protein [Patescibacteria group bacterium]|nr:DUF192 domain-containing protein [Patescibacteria group bacterium]